MTKLSLELANYPRNHDQVVVLAEEAQVNLDVSDVDADDGLKGYVVLEPDEARSLAALLVAQAEAAER